MTIISHDSTHGQGKLRPAVLYISLLGSRQAQAFYTEYRYKIELVDFGNSKKVLKVVKIGFQLKRHCYISV
jgi:hypothetical protein